MLWLLRKLFGKKKKKKTLKQRIIKWIVTIAIIVLCLLVFYFFTTILPVFLLSSTTTSLVIRDDLIFTDNNVYKPPTGSAPGEGNGEAVELSGGLEAMGVDFSKTITDLQTQLASATTDDEKKLLQGKIAYTQLFQIMNAETEMTSHPVMLLGTAMGIREISLFSGKYSDITTVMGGTDRANGIYGTWCNKCINGLPNKGGGVIPHVMSKIPSSIAGKGGTAIPALLFTDLSNNTTLSISLNQNYSTAYYTEGENINKAMGYNKGAYGPLQIEADHWVTWVCPYIESSESYNAYLNQAYINIPITDTRFDGLYSAARGPVGGVAQSVVTSNKSHLEYYRQNQKFVDDVMATVGHPNYIQEFATLVNDTPAGQATFGAGTDYYFTGRFTRGQDWEDWVMSLEAWPHAFTCFAIDRIGAYCMFENTAELKKTSGEVIASNAFKAAITNKFGDKFTFVNNTAEDIYWTLEMLQSWNYGAPNTNYTAENRYYLGYFYRELANYIAVYGTADIRLSRPNSENCNPRAKCSCGGNHKVSVYSGQGTTSQNACTSFAYTTYLNLANLVCTANGTRYNADGTDTETYTKIHKALYNQQASTYHKNNYGYAITAILDAEANIQTMMKDIFGLEGFSIFNYGGSSSGVTDSAPTIDGYNYNEEVPLSTTVDSTYFQDAVFIGDDLTTYFQTNSGCSAAGYFCKVGVTPQTLLSDPVLSNLSSTTYNKVYIMVGIHDANNTNGSFKTNYINLIDYIKLANPNAVIYIQSILPVSNETNVTNDQIQVQNNVLRQIASEKKCFYVNVRDAFVNDDKTVKAELYEGEINLKSTSYATWLNYLKTHTVSIPTSSVVPEVIPEITPTPAG